MLNILNKIELIKFALLLIVIMLVMTINTIAQEAESIINKARQATRENRNAESATLFQQAIEQQPMRMLAASWRNYGTKNLAITIAML